MQVISSLAELDAKLAECEAASKVSDDALRHVFTTFRMDFSKQVPADPFSSEYRDFQMALYRQISGRSYTPQNEVSKFDVEAADRRPFPFYTGSCKTAGFFTMGTGFLLHSLSLAAGNRVVEFGPGWGNTTIAMAMLGLEVTAVDIEKDFCELLRRRARRQEVNITVINADFMWAETVRDAFDAAIFFECFHHCADHMRLLKALHVAVKPGGRIYFGAEPIIANFPLPWGLRMDGESLWAIRSNGWMELGYHETYFQEALARTGWTGIKHVMPDLAWASVWEARRSEEVEVRSGPVNNTPAANEAPAAPIIRVDETNAVAEQSPITEEFRLREELNAVYRSTSWRVTAPLRALAKHLRDTRHRANRQL
jgi:2-polyprenyl-3-methyl-5-hydroxy-6-metoxy-1,4-benzoquinol methylase